MTDEAPTCQVYVPYYGRRCGFLAKWRAGATYACDAHVWRLSDAVELPDADLIRLASRARDGGEPAGRA